MNEGILHIYDSSNTCAISPISGSVPIFFGCNASFLPHAMVTIASIIDNSTEKFDFFILYSDIDPKDLEKSAQWVFSKGSSLRFVNVSTFYDKLKRMTTYRFSSEYYIRILAPDVFENFDKILYLDSDIVVNWDIAELYRIPLENHLLGACRDKLIWEDVLNGLDEGRSDFIMDKIGCTDFYFNSGVVIFNLKLLRGMDFLDTCIRAAEFLGSEHFGDQDILNHVCLHRVLELGMEWNVNSWMADPGEDCVAFFRLPEKVRAELRELPVKIMHYTGPKPWQIKYRLYANDLYWIHAVKTPFYHAILDKLNGERKIGRLALAYLSCMFHLAKIALLKNVAKKNSAKLCGKYHHYRNRKKCLRRHFRKKIETIFGVYRDELMARAN